MVAGRISKILAAFALCVHAAAVSPSPAPIVDLGYAKYQGILVQDTQTNETNTYFLGMRYAAPPTGTASQTQCTTFPR